MTHEVEDVILQGLAEKLPDHYVWAIENQGHGSFVNITRDANYVGMIALEYSYQHKRKVVVCWSDENIAEFLLDNPDLDNLVAGCFHKRFVYPAILRQLAADLPDYFTTSFIPAPKSSLASAGSLVVYAEHYLGCFAVQGSTLRYVRTGKVLATVQLSHPDVVSVVVALLDQQKDLLGVIRGKQ